MYLSWGEVGNVCKITFAVKKKELNRADLCCYLDADTSLLFNTLFLVLWSCCLLGLCSVLNICSKENLPSKSLASFGQSTEISEPELIPFQLYHTAGGELFWQRFVCLLSKPLYVHMLIVTVQNTSWKLILKPANTCIDSVLSENESSQGEKRR